MERNQYCILMTGGLGSRFWPLSTRKVPKQFIDILGTGKSLLQQAYDRFSPKFADDKIIVVSNVDYEQLTREQLPNIPPQNILCEPVSKDTAICILYAVYRIKSQDPDAEIIVSPTDHVIMNDNALYESLDSCLKFANDKDAIVSMGLHPRNPNDGYGYIQYKKESVEAGISPIKTFVEKPNQEMAQLFVDSEEFLWNTGIMVASIETILKAYATHLPEVYSLFEQHAASFGTSQEPYALKDIYPQCDKISVSYGIMEKAENSFVQLADFDWADLGTWTALYEIADKDPEGNCVNNDNIMLYETENCIVNSLTDRKIVVDGLKDYIVADSGKSLLIMPKKRESTIKTVINTLRLKRTEKINDSKE